MDRQFGVLLALGMEYLIPPPEQGLHHRLQNHTGTPKSYRPRSASNTNISPSPDRDRYGCWNSLAMRLQDPIDCRLVETSLPADATTGGTLDYEALSYVWGSPTGDRPILCEDGVILVTKNCESALRYLRDRYRSRQLWIDSVCIDQTSDEEKAQQVPLMGDVYRLARRTIIWLGEGNERSIAGMNYVQIISWIPGRWLKTKFSKTWNCKRPALRQFCH